MGKRGRARARSEAPGAPTTDYTDAEGNVLTLRGSLTLKTRAEYSATAAAGSGARAATAEDDWHRAVEFLFERLAARWVVAGVATEKQSELLARFRVASDDERRWIRDVLREHLAENFPDVEAP
ncbi:MAG: hypothetical protein WD649_05325 [Thermoleophilaceae bacterium]